MQWIHELGIQSWDMRRLRWRSVAWWVVCEGRRWERCGKGRLWNVVFFPMLMRWTKEEGRNKLWIMIIHSWKAFRHLWTIHNCYCIGLEEMVLVWWSWSNVGSLQEKSTARVSLVVSVLRPGRNLSSMSLSSMDLWQKNCRILRWLQVGCEFNSPPKPAIVALTGVPIVPVRWHWWLICSEKACSLPSISRAFQA